MKLYLRTKKEKELTGHQIVELLAITMKYTKELKSLGFEPVTTLKFEK
jgi:hypothetical protein